jgi:hypothetical protein
MFDYALPGCVLIAIILALVGAWSVRGRFPRLLPKLLGIMAAVVVIAFAAPACFAAFDKLGLLPMACGDGAIGDALLFLGFGYLLSLIGLVFCQVYNLFAGRCRSIVKALAIGASVVVFVVILALIAVLGRRWLGGIMSMALFGFAVLQLGYWVMLLADTIICSLFRSRSPDSGWHSEPT